MNVPNPNQETLQDILPRAQELYPDAVIKKPLIGSETLQIADGKILFVIRKRKEDFVVNVDFSKSIGMTIGRVALGAFGSMIAKSILTSKNKARIEMFNNNFADIVAGIGKEHPEAVAKY
ncbi:hypothetical protein QJ048_09625 [Pinibacter sp. MAH-24]|uniref:Uncharacterized protein n=2 Tax=Pinibacter soli TaxID=3044211 RepID=A0ABT6RBT7_9BACT|nr:hypothetical protein [Pinibacter soli]